MHNDRYQRRIWILDAMELLKIDLLSIHTLNNRLHDIRVKHGDELRENMIMRWCLTKPRDRFFKDLTGSDNAMIRWNY